MTELEIRKGQVWESRDRRDAGRKVRVVDADEHGAYLQSLTGPGRRTWARAATLRRYYRLVEDVTP